MIAVFCGSSAEEFLTKRFFGDRSFRFCPDAQSMFPVFLAARLKHAKRLVNSLMVVAAI
jgi:hypothetical protein